MKKIMVDTAIVVATCAVLGTVFRSPWVAPAGILVAGRVSAFGIAWAWAACRKARRSA